LGIELYERPLSEAVESVISTCLSTAPRTSHLVSATGAHGLVHAQHNSEFAATLRQFHMNLPDGMPGVWVGRYVKGARNMERMRGPDFFRTLMTQSASTSVRHYFCGGKEGVADKLRDACATKFGNHNVVGTYCPPFRALTEDEWQMLADNITKSGADVVWIGISTPKQERFAVELSKRVKVHYIATVGAAFDFHIGAVREAPAVVQKSGLEWFYRMLLDPNRLVRRYVEVVPLFLYYNVRDLVQERRVDE
jgi:N-acetylglucosaminyldiphosphoundecaprenol N-acetyl-beta-D-mannosaminyltransferase